MKKVIAMLLALMLIVSVSATVFADGETGSITINGVSAEGTYEIYKLLDLESYDTTAGAYSYKANAAWTAFFASDAAKAYFTTDDAGYVTWTWTPASGDITTEDEAVAAFAKMALAYAKAQSPAIAPVKSSKNDGEFTVTGTAGKFEGLELGYYLVDSTVGALCGLTTTNPNASINAKNGSPIIEKQVREDSTQQWGSTNSADIAQTVEFRVTINVHAGAENYVLHDKMSDGLTFVGVAGIEHLVPGTATETVGTEYYTVVTGDDLDDDCTFEVRFTQDFCDHLETNDKIVVSYTAMLNRDAVIAGAGNPNTAKLTYGEGHQTAESSTITYTYGIDIVKTDSQNKLIDGAKFRIYDDSLTGNEIAVVLMEDGETYRRARADEVGVDIVVKNGQVRVVGFDNGTYYLEETEAPEGYNKLTSRQKFIISDSNLDATFNDGVYSTGSGVHVVNKTGSMLPETGGIGTLLFTVLGGTTAMGTGVVLVTKKRMSKIKDED